MTLLTVPLTQWARRDGTLHLLDTTEEEAALDRASREEARLATALTGVPKAFKPLADIEHTVFVFDDVHRGEQKVIDMTTGNRTDLNRTVVRGFTQVQKDGTFRAPASLKDLKVPEGLTVFLSLQSQPQTGATNGMHVFGERVRPLLDDYEVMYQMASAELSRTPAVLASLTPTWMRFCAVERNEPGLFGLRELTDEVGNPTNLHLAYDGMAWLGYLTYPRHGDDLVGWVTWDNDLRFLQSAYCMYEARTKLHRSGRRQSFSLAGWAVGPGLNRAQGNYGNQRSGSPPTKPRMYKQDPVAVTGKKGPTDLYYRLNATIIGKLIACRYDLDKAGDLPHKLEAPRYGKDLWAEGDVPIHTSPKGTLLLYGDSVACTNLAMIHEDRAPIEAVRANYQYHHSLRRSFPDRFTDDEVTAIRDALTQCVPTPRDMEE